MKSGALSLVAVFAWVIAAQAHAQPTNECASATANQEKASKAYADKLDQFNEENPPDESQPTVCVGGKVRWEKTTMSLKIPVFKSAEKAFSFNVPETTLKDKSFTIKEPITVCENKKIGQKPEVTCHGVLSCTTHWRDIITKVCWPETRDKKVVTAIPEFKMTQKKLRFSVPEVAMKNREFSLHTPKFFADSGCIGPDCAKECKDQLEDRNADLESKRDNFLTGTRTGLISATSDMYSCHADSIQKQKEFALGEYDKYIAVAEATLKALRENGLVDAAKDQDAQLAEMKARRKATMDEMDKAAQDLMEQARSAAQSIGGT